MRKLFVAACASAVSGCASFSATIPPLLNAHPGDSAEIQSLIALRNSYVERAHALNGDNLLITGLGVTAAIAALGFASFEAHPDNLTAASLISGASLVANGQLNPHDKARLMIGALNAIECLISNDRAFATPPRVTAPAGANGLLSSMNLGTGETYESVDAALVVALTLAASDSLEAPRLKAAVAKGENARARLAAAIKARDQFPHEVLKVKTSIQAAVNAERAPSLSELLQKIGEVKPPERTDPVQNGGNTPTPPDSPMAAFSGNADVLAGALEILAGMVDRLRPEKEEEAIKAVQACPAAMALN